MSFCPPSGFPASVAIPAENVVTLWYSAGRGPAYAAPGIESISLTC